jgi:hypothetical protein
LKTVKSEATSSAIRASAVRSTDPPHTRMTAAPSP